MAFPSHGFARAGPAAATLVFAVCSASRFLLCRGRGAVVRFEWKRGGAWRVRSRAYGWQAARLLRATTLGPCTLLVWEGAAGRRLYALLDARAIGRPAHAALRARLRLARSPQPSAVSRAC